MENALSQITPFNLDRDQINHFISKATEEAISGNYDLLDIFYNLKVLSEISDSLLKNLKDDIFEEAEKYEGKEFFYKGVKISKVIRNTPIYKTCNDSVLNEAEKVVKERKAMLKNLTKPMADPETGEIIKPPVVSSTSYLTIKI